MELLRNICYCINCGILFYLIFLVAITKWNWISTPDRDYTREYLAHSRTIWEDSDLSFHGVWNGAANNRHNQCRN